MDPDVEFLIEEIEHAMRRGEICLASFPDHVTAIHTFHADSEGS
jgi:hypothetical protein